MDGLWAQRYLGAVFLTLSGCGAAPTPAIHASSLEPGASDPGFADTSALDAEELAFANAINAYRAQSGLAPLGVSIALTRAADWQSGDMASNSCFSHTDTLGRDPFTRISAFGYPASGTRGENIAAGNATAGATFTQWKNSAGHNANMLNSAYRVIGIARAYRSGSPYGWYWTTDFGSTVDALAF